MRRKSKNLTYLRLGIFLIITIFLLFKADYNLNQIYSKIITDKLNICFIILAFIIFHNIIGIRMFVIFKLGLKNFLKYFKWMKLYYESLSMNMILSHTGTAYRAYQLKKNGVSYKDFLSFLYILYFTYIIFNIIVVLLELIIFLEGDSKLKLYLGFFLGSSVFFFLIFPRTIKKIIFIFKNNYKIKYLNILYNITSDFAFKIKILLRNKKILIALLISGFLIHAFEMCLFYLSFQIFLGDTSLSKYILLFAVSFIIDSIPFIKSIPGLSEILYATISIPFGFDFTYSFLTKFLLTFSSIVSLSFNYFIHSTINYSLYKKLK